MMDAFNSIRCCRLLLILLGVHASLAFAKPRAKADLSHERPRNRAQSSAMVASSRRSLLRRRMGSQTSGQTIRNLADYKEEIARKMTNVRTPEEFLRVFFPVDTVKSRWTMMVNESVQNAWRAGRTGAEDVDADRPAFTEKTAEQELEEVNNHGVSVRCHEPAPVLIDMYEELNLTRGGLVYVYPECTLVNRCEGSGCCQGGAPCVGKKSARENISRQFIVMRVLPDPLRHKDATYISTYSLYADTECMCMERPLVPICQPRVCSNTMTFNEVTCQCDCNKPCPKPYIQDPDTCDCKCADKDGGCNKIKRSRRRMAAPECTCVMDNRCFPPSCKKGYEFSTRSCKCAVKDNTKRQDRERDRGAGRTDTQTHRRPELPPLKKHGRTNLFNPEIPMLSSSEAEPPNSYTGYNSGFESSDQDNEDPETLMVQDELRWDLDTVPSEDCGSNCRREGFHENGSGNGGD